MEETAKEIKLNAEQKTKNAEAGQPTPEQLRYYCDQLLAQRNELAQRLSSVQTVITKLPFLFDVVKNKEVFNQDFVNRCISEIEMILTPENEETSTTESKAND